MHSAIAVESCAALTTSNAVAIPPFGASDASGDDPSSQNAEDLFREAMTSAATLSRLTEPGPSQCVLDPGFWIRCRGPGFRDPAPAAP